MHVAYQTSGNIAVWDEDALRFADFAMQYLGAFGSPNARLDGVGSQIALSLQEKQPGQVWRFWPHSENAYSASMLPTHFVRSMERFISCQAGREPTSIQQHLS